MKVIKRLLLILALLTSANSAEIRPEGGKINRARITNEVPVADRYVSPAGSDAADGATYATPWLTLTQVRTYVNALPANSTKTIHIRAGNYIEAAAALYYAPVNTGVVTTTNFAPGVTVTFGSGAGDAIGASVGTHTFNLSGATFTSAATVGSDGIGIAFAAVVTVNGSGATFIGNEDGWSGHNTSVSTVNDCTFMESAKGGFTHVNTAVTTANRCTFIAKTAASLGVGRCDLGTTSAFTDCTFTPATSGQNIGFPGGTLTRCKIGTPTLSLTQSYTAQQVTSYTDCYFNLFQTGLGNNSIYTRCYGKWTHAMRGTSTDVATITNCVFTGPATGQISWMTAPNGFGVGTFEPGTVTVRNTIFTGYTNVFSPATGNVQGTVDSIVAGINARWVLQGWVLFGNTTDYNDGTATITPPSPVVTADPLLVAPTSMVQTDYYTGAASPARNAGYLGGNIGLPQ